MNANWYPKIAVHFEIFKRLEFIAARAKVYDAYIIEEEYPPCDVTILSLYILCL